MKKEINPAIFFAVIAVIVIGAAAFYFVGGGGGAGGQVDVKQLDPKDLKDEEPPRRGQPGYRERIDQPASQ
jgi:hypothetical protein